MLPATGNRLESACAFVQDVLWSASPRGDATLEPWIIRSVARQLTNHLASRLRQRFERVLVPFRTILPCALPFPTGEQRRNPTKSLERKKLLNGSPSRGQHQREINSLKRKAANLVFQ